MGNGWGGDSRSPGTSDGGASRSSMGQSGSPVTLSSTYSHACLLGWAMSLRSTPPILISRPAGAAAGSREAAGGNSPRRP